MEKILFYVSSGISILSTFPHPYTIGIVNYKARAICIYDFFNIG